MFPMSSFTQIITKVHSQLHSMCDQVGEFLLGPDSGLSPGYGLSLRAETTTGCFLSCELMGDKGVLPEDLARNCTKMLLHEIIRVRDCLTSWSKHSCLPYKGGCVDTSHQALPLMMMALGPEDASKIRIGKLSPYTWVTNLLTLVEIILISVFRISLLQHIKQFFDVTFQITPDPETKTTILTCFGCGYKNLAKQTW